MGYRSHLQSLPKAETSGTTHTRDLGLLGTAQERQTCINPGGPGTAAAGSECGCVSSSLELSVKPTAGSPLLPGVSFLSARAACLFAAPKVPMSLTHCYAQTASRQPGGTSQTRPCLSCNARAWSAEQAVQVSPSLRSAATPLPELPSTAQTWLPFPACSLAPSAALPVHSLCFHISEPDLEVCVEILPLHLQHGHVPAACEL